MLTSCLYILTDFVRAYGLNWFEVLHVTWMFAHPFIAKGSVQSVQKLGHDSITPASVSIVNSIERNVKVFPLASPATSDFTSM